MASMTGFSASQAWDNVNVSAGRDFNFSINGPGHITEMKERGMDHSHDVSSTVSDDSLPCRKATGDHGACQLDFTIELQSSARERVLEVYHWNGSEDTGLQRL
jgi:hypothetical protein